MRLEGQYSSGYYQATSTVGQWGSSNLNKNGQHANATHNQTQNMECKMSSLNPIITQKNSESQQFDKAFISKPDLDILVERVLLINSHILEYQQTMERLGEELRLVESYLKTYQRWVSK